MLRIFIFVIRQHTIILLYWRRTLVQQTVFSKIRTLH